MKKVIIGLILLSFMSNINAQVTQDPRTINHADDIELGKYYKKKARNLNIAGWAMLGGGISMMLLSGSVVYEDGDAAYGLALAGTISTVGSIPMFIMGAKNKGRAEILLRSSNIPLSFDAGKNIPVKSVGIGFTIGR